MFRGELKLSVMINFLLFLYSNCPNSFCQLPENLKYLTVLDTSKLSPCKVKVSQYIPPLSLSPLLVGGWGRMCLTAIRRLFALFKSVTEYLLFIYHQMAEAYYKLSMAFYSYSRIYDRHHSLLRMSWSCGRLSAWACWSWAPLVWPQSASSQAPLTDFVLIE